jgi:hypothetical protein
MAYRDAHTNLGIAYRERPPGGAQTDSQEVRQFLEKLTQANPSRSGCCGSSAMST